jgi:hypothetical protein
MQRRFSRAHVRFRLAAAVHALVELALRDRLLLPQALRALVLAHGVREACLRGDDLGLGALHFGDVWRGIDRHERSPALTSAPSLNCTELHGAGDAGAHVDALHRFQAAGKLFPRGDLAAFDRRDRYRDGGRRGIRLLARGRVAQPKTPRARAAATAAVVAATASRRVLRVAVCIL